MPWSLPGQAPVTRMGPASREPAGRVPQWVDTVYDFSIYRVGTKFHAVDVRTRASLGEFPARLVAVRAIMAFYEANGMPRHASPNLNLADKHRPMGYFTSRRTST